MDTEIIIIGGGPVGLALSLALRKYNIKSVIIEKRLQPTPLAESRAIVWMPKGLEFLEWMGLFETFKENSTVRTFHQFRHKGKPILTLDLNLSNSKFKHSLNLPQHITEALLEDEVLKHTDFIEIRRGQELVEVNQNENGTTVIIVNTQTKESYRLTSKILVGCDGTKSKVRELLGIKLNWNDYGTFSAVADIDTKLITERTDISWIELDPRRPYGLFNFHPDKWRLIYRVNANEPREQVTTTEYVDNLIKQYFPQIRNYTFLWASAFRLGQGQSQQYSKDRVVLAGDAAHPMGPSAGAGMMVGMLGVWRLAWRLKEAVLVNSNTSIQKLFAAYETEQRQGSKAIQGSNAKTFSQIALTTTWKAMLRNFVLKLISKITFIKRKMIEADTLTDQTINYR